MQTVNQVRSMFEVPNSKFVFLDPDLSPKPLQIDESKIEQIVNTSGKHKQNMFMI